MTDHSRRPDPPEPDPPDRRDDVFFLVVFFFALAFFVGRAGDFRVDREEAVFGRVVLVATWAPSLHRRTRCLPGRGGRVPPGL